MFSVSSIWSSLLALLHPTSSIQAGVSPWTASLPHCHSWYHLLQPATWFNWEHAGCHLQKRLRKEVVIFPTIRGSAGQPHKLLLPSHCELAHLELLQACGETPEYMVWMHLWCRGSPSGADGSQDAPDQVWMMGHGELSPGVPVVTRELHLSPGVKAVLWMESERIQVWFWLCLLLSLY